MASSALSRRPSRSNSARGALLAGVGVDDQGARERSAEGATRGVRCALHGRPALGGAVGVLDRAPEPLGEPGYVGLGGLVPERPAQRVVGVVGELGRGQDVGEGLAHVVEVGDPVPPHVDEELGGAEALAQRHRRPGGEGRRPPRHQGVRVEERHRQVADVVLGELEHLGHDGTDAGQPPLAAQACLGRPRRPRGEQQQPERLLGHPGLGLVGQRRPGRLTDQPAVDRAVVGADVAGGVVDHQDAVGRQGRTQVMAFDQAPVPVVGDQQLALGVGEVAGQLVAPVGRVPPDQHRSGEGGGSHPEHVLGDVVQ
jgi:hypothetical protein